MSETISRTDLGAGHTQAAQMAERKYSPEQRAAIIEATLDQGMSAAKAVAAAARGELGVAPFEMPESTAWRIRKDEKDDRECEAFLDLARTSAPHAARDVVARAMLRLNRELVELEASPPGTLDLDRVNRLFRCTAYAIRLQDRTPSSPPPSEHVPKDPRTPDSLTHQLLAADEEMRETPSTSGATTPDRQASPPNDHTADNGHQPATASASDSEPIDRLQGLSPRIRELLARSSSRKPS